jgi:hypothetical protein
MDATPRKAPATSGGHRHTLWFLAAFYALAIVSGARQAYWFQESLLDLLIPLAEALCLGLWAEEDANRRGYPIPMLSRSWFILLPLILVPAYLVWSRGWRGLAWILINCVAWFVLTGVACVAVWLMMFGANA